MRAAKTLRDLMELPETGRFVVVAHDRGGAEVISDFAPHLGGEARFVTAGPARGVFDAVLPDRLEVSLADGLDWADTAIIGTGWQTDWELSAEARAQDCDLRTAVVLDNWVNFRGRFQHHGLEVTPSELWVVDELAARTASVTFPAACVRVLPWSHYDAVVDEIQRARRAHPRVTDQVTRVLFVGENVSEFASTVGGGGEFGFSQFDALTHLAGLLEERLDGRFLLRIRPHPSERSASYAPALRRLPGHASISSGSLVEDLTWCDWAVGLSSIALYFADRSGTPTYTCFPFQDSPYHHSPWGFPTIEEALDASS